MTGTGWTVTREQLVDALAAIELRPVLLPGRDKGTIVAEWMADVILEELPPPARAITEYAVAWGGEDPNDCAGILVYDGAEAGEHVQRIRDSYVARRTVTRSRWERVPETGAREAVQAPDGPGHDEPYRDIPEGAEAVSGALSPAKEDSR